MRAYIFVRVYVTVCLYHVYVCIYMCVHVKRSLIVLSHATIQELLLSPFNPHKIPGF